MHGSCHPCNHHWHDGCKRELDIFRARPESSSVILPHALNLGPLPIATIGLGALAAAVMSGADIILSASRSERGMSIDHSL